MSSLKANEITDSNDDSCQNGFSDLRRLARIVDNGVKEVKTRIEEIESDGVGSNLDHRQQYLNETAALLFLQRSQKDIKSISLDTKSIHDDFKMRSSTLNSVSCLFECALESFKNRLEIVESFTEQYGYKRPLLSLPDLVTPSSLDETAETANEIDGNKQVDSIDQTRLQNMADPAENDLNIERNRNFSDPGTPKLEDRYLSENTLSILNSDCFDNYGSCTPAEKKTALISPPQPTNEIEMSTPKLEACGISEHTLKYLLSEDAQVDETVPVENSQKTYESLPKTPILRGVSFDYNFESNLATTMKQEKEEQNVLRFDLPPTPKLELDGLSEHTLIFLNSANAVDTDKENICLDSTPVAASPTSHYHQSPDLDPVVCQSHDSPYLNMPATPKLNSLGLSQHTLRFLNSNEESLF